MINQSRALRNEPVARSMEHLQVLLLDRFHRHKSHCRAKGSLMYRFGITRVIFGTFDKWFDEARMNEANAVSLVLEPSAPVIRTGAGFHGQAFRRQFQDGGFEFRSAHLL